MVTISGFNERQNAEGKPFYALILQGGLDLVLSEETGRYYATAKTASITSTFDEATCKGLVGTKLPGRITNDPVRSLRLHRQGDGGNHHPDAQVGLQS